MSREVTRPCDLATNPMEALRLQRRYPQFSQEDMMGFMAKFRQLDVEDKGSLDKQTVFKEVSDLERVSYDQVRETLKDVDVDASGRVELEDYVDLISRLRSGSNAEAGVSNKGRVTV